MTSFVVTLTQFAVPQGTEDQDTSLRATVVKTLLYKKIDR